jgi:hypothetical protein
MTVYPTYTHWSAYYEGRRAGLKHAHPFTDAKKVRYSSNWERHVEVEVKVNGDLWLDLWFAADAAVRATNDERILAIEGFKPDPEDPTVLILSAGS